jgi:hypothetical protein
MSDAETLPATTQQAIARQPEETNIAGSDMFLAAARDPNVSVEKLERLIALQKQILDREAEQAFNIAFARMQAQLPVVAERGKGDKNMAYAKLEDIVETVRPVLKEHGFSLRHATSWPDDKTIIITGWLTHSGGHSVSSAFRSAADSSGSKNAVQALGSTMSYGRRYTTLDLLCIVSREGDDDGRASSKKDKEPEKPDGFDTWANDLDVVAEDGVEALEAVWNSSRQDWRRYMLATDRTRWETIKRRAASLDAKKKGGTK